MIITLLTMKEAERLPKELRQCKHPKKYDGHEFEGKCYWWLRSPGDFNYEAAYVNVDGWFGYGYINNYKSYGIRPALQVLTSDEIARMPKTKDGYIKFLGTKWIDVSEYLSYPCLLKKKCLKNPHGFDSESNDYKTSEIKRFIDKWLNDKIRTNIDARMILYGDRWVEEYDN